MLQYIELDDRYRLVHGQNGGAMLNGTLLTIV
jgi:hypothetical protein